MTVTELAARVQALESAMEEVRSRLGPPAGQRRWWRESAGRFANDPIFDEIVRLGREYRDGQRSEPKKPRPKKHGDS